MRKTLKLKALIQRLERLRNILTTLEEDIPICFEEAIVEETIRGTHHPPDFLIRRNEMLEKTKSINDALERYLLSIEEYDLYDILKIRQRDKKWWKK